MSVYVDQQKSANLNRSAAGTIGGIADFGSAGNGSILGGEEKTNSTRTRKTVIEAEKNDGEISKKDVRKIWKKRAGEKGIEIIGEAIVGLKYWVTK